MFSVLDASSMVLSLRLVIVDGDWFRHGVKWCGFVTNSSSALIILVYERRREVKRWVSKLLTTISLSQFQASQSKVHPNCERYLYLLRSPFLMTLPS